MGTPGPLPGVGKTALGMARVRARESQRDDRLFDDPYAQAFVDAAPAAYPDDPQTAGQLAALGPLAAFGAAFYAHAVIRTRFYDDYLTTATSAGCAQVVLLAAGLDTRAFRLAWPGGVRLYELDLPEVLAFKEPVLGAHGAAPRCDRVTVPTDLRTGWPARLIAAGFDTGRPAAWLAEGLLIYLTPADAEHLLTAVTGLAAPGSRLAFEHNPAGRDTLTTRAAQIPAMRQYTALWKGGLANAPGWLTSHGWQTEFHSLAALGSTYGRPVPDSASSGFLTATQVHPSRVGPH